METNLQEISSDTQLEPFVVILRKKKKCRQDIHQKHGEESVICRESNKDQKELSMVVSSI